MKTFHTILLACFLAFLSLTAQAQDAKTLVSQGVALHDQGKYAEAIDKYNEAIKLDPGFALAYYESGYTLFSTGKGKDAIPYLEKCLTLNPKAGGAYDILGSIYDDDKQPEKAIEYFKKGIEADPVYQRLPYNLAVTYMRLKKYEEAERYAIDAIKLDPKHPSSQRVYAIATYNLRKRGISLLAWCSFLMLEPQTQRSAEAYSYINTILNFGISRSSEKQVNITVSPKDLDGGNFTMPIAILAATTDKKGLTAIDSLTLQLKSLFQVSSTFQGKKQDDFYTHFYSQYFSKLAATDNMPAFARLVSLSVYKDENTAWFKEHDKELSAMSKWIADTERKF